MLIKYWWKSYFQLYSLWCNVLCRHEVLGMWAYFIISLVTWKRWSYFSSVRSIPNALEVCVYYSVVIAEVVQFFWCSRKAAPSWWQISEHTLIYTAHVSPPHSQGALCRGGAAGVWGRVLLHHRSVRALQLQSGRAERNPKTWAEGNL